ncbi:hypothetical protein [Streptomyces sp. NPDC001100]
MALFESAHEFVGLPHLRVLAPERHLVARPDAQQPTVEGAPVPRQYMDAGDQLLQLEGLRGVVAGTIVSPCALAPVLSWAVRRRTRRVDAGGPVDAEGGTVRAYHLQDDQDDQGEVLGDADRDRVLAALRHVREQDVTTGHVNGPGCCNDLGNGSGSRGNTLRKGCVPLSSCRSRRALFSAPYR